MPEPAHKDSSGAGADGIRAMALPKIGRAGAVLADKAHFNVLVDVRKMLSELGEDELKFQGIYRARMAREKECRHE